MNTLLTVCEVEVYSERRGTLFVDAYDDRGDNGSSDDLQLQLYKV